MKTASAQARDRWRLVPVGAGAPDGAVSGTHALGAAERVGEVAPAPAIVAPLPTASDSALQLAARLERAELAAQELRAERDALSGRLERALSDVARLEGIVRSLRPEPAAAPVVAPPALPVAPPPPAPAPLVSSPLSAVSLQVGARQLEVTFLHDSHLICDFDRDISEGGIFVATYEALELGSRVELCLELGERLLQARGAVRWSLPAGCESEQRPGYAVFFEQLSDEAAQCLRDYCRVHPPHYYEV